MKEKNRKEKINENKKQEINSDNNKSTKKQNKKRNTIILIVLLLIFILCGAYLIFYYIKHNKKEIPETIEDTIIEEEPVEVIDTRSQAMIQLEEVKKENDEAVAWLTIEDTNINYPVLQTNNNDYYLKHNYKKEYSSTGSLFLDKDVDLINGSSNYLIYGHRSTAGDMFEDLMKYAKKDFYETHKQIKYTTLEEESTYEVLAVFYSRVYYKNEKNVFRYYYFVNAENEQEYNSFVTNAKKASIYNTGITATYGDQLMTLSTCEYSQEDGRFAVVLRKNS